jgi:hypothetical protein
LATRKRSEAIDPDALNSLFDGSSEPAGSATVSFDYCGLQGPIDVDGIRVAGPEPAAR